MRPAAALLQHRRLEFPAVLAPARALECQFLIHSPHDPQSWGRSSFAANDSRWNGQPLTHVLTPNDFSCLEAVAERLANFKRYFESIARPFQWKSTRTNHNALIARVRDRWAQSQPLKLAA
jgi:hypothetical protein